MGFTDLPTIETADTYLDNAFKKARAMARDHTLGDHEKSKIQREKTLGLIKINAIKDYLIAQFDIIIAKYPNMDNLSEFYVQLLRLTLNFKQLKKSLGSLNWANDQIRILNRVTRPKLLGTTEVEQAQQAQRAYYGRISSVIKQIKKELAYLHLARQMMRTYPSIKENLFTVCIAGFPNVGKSTLLSKITPAKPEIGSYAFTTKQLNLGYMTTEGIKFQFIDTPGTLNRIEKMNPIETQAYLAIRYVANAIIYVFDITEESGYMLKDQQKLLKVLKETGKTIYCYLSRTDLLRQEEIDAFMKTFDKKKIPLFTSFDDIQIALLSQYKKDVQ